MIVDERLVTYINSLDTGNTEILDEIEREALENLCADRAQGNAELSETDLIDKKTRKNP